VRGGISSPRNLLLVLAENTSQRIEDLCKSPGRYKIIVIEAADPPPPLLMPLITSKLLIIK
jgi:hypothetical protein